MNIARASASASALVIGGGVIGLFSAWRLAEAGFAVRLIERDRVGRGASWAGGGILSPLQPWLAPPAVWALARQSLLEYPQLAQELAEATGIDPEWTPSGMQLVAPDEAEAIRSWAQRERLMVHDSQALLAGMPVPTLLLPWVAQLRSPRLCRALDRHLRQLGVTVDEHRAVQGLRAEGKRVVVDIADGSLHADAVVLAAGAWSGPLLDGLGWPQPIAPVKGQMIVLRGPPGRLPHIQLQGDRYLIPRRDGRVLVGSTLEPEAGFDQTVQVEVGEALRRFAATLQPELAEGPIEHQWSGLRPGSPQGVPLIARHPQLSNLYVNAGHHRNGLTLAPASAAELLRLIDVG